MKNRILIIIIFSFVVSLAIILIFLNGSHIKNENQVCFKEHCFFVELAISDEEKNVGLMFREELGPDRGMLFVFEKEGRYSFWMKNTLIPLDIIWFDKDGKVVFISENNLPCEQNFCPSINPLKNATYVLEVNAGLAEKNGIIVGDKADFRNR